MKTVQMWLASVLLVALAQAALPPDITKQIDDLTAVRPVPTKSADEWRAQFAPLVDAVVVGLATTDAETWEAAQHAFDRVCEYTAEPGADAARAALAGLLAERLTPSTPQAVRHEFLLQLKRMGGVEVVPALVATLAGDDAQLAEAARRALVTNPAPEAAAALRDALANTAAPTQRAALSAALGARRDGGAVEALARLVGDADARVAESAIAALGQIADGPACHTLETLLAGATDANRSGIVTALLCAAERAIRDGKRERAAAAARAVYSGVREEHDRMRALAVLARADWEPAARELLLRVHAAAPLAERRDAVRLLASIPNERVTRALIVELRRSQPDMQVTYLEELAKRNDPAVPPLLAYFVEQPDAGVRLAAARGLAVAGDRDCVLPLARVAAADDGPDAAAARTALARVAGPQINDMLLDAVAEAPGRVAAELANAVAARRLVSAVPALLARLSDEDLAVVAAALAALASLGGSDSVDALAGTLTTTTSDDVVRAAQDALVAICQRDADEHARVAPLRTAWEQRRTEPGGPRLLPVLARLGGADALEILRAAARDSDAVVVDAAIRGLASWSNIAALDDLAALSQEAGDETQRVLALRGYVRLVQKLAASEPPAAVQRLVAALAWPVPPAEQRRVVGALAQIDAPAALQALVAALDREELRTEVEVAILQLAPRLAGVDRGAAAAEIERVAATATDADRRAVAAEKLREVQRAVGYVTTWEISGPYSVPDGDWQAALRERFAPETGGEAAWRPLDGTGLEPWRIDLEPVGKCQNCCVYLRCAAYVPVETAAQLLVGSDDAAVVWLNGERVHAAELVRGHTSFEDVVGVHLKAGWNELLVKVAQAAGGWGVSCGLVAEDGGPLPGVRIERRTPPDANP